MRRKKGCPALDIWMSFAKQRRKCSHCPEPIVQLDRIVVGKTRRKVGGKTFTRVKAWHVKCWIIQGMMYLDNHPPIIKTGRPRLALTQEQRQQRLKVLMQHAQYMYQYRQAWERKDVQAAVGYYIKAYELRPRMADLGGIPKSWEVNVAGAQVASLTEEEGAGTPSGFVEGES